MFCGRLFGENFYVPVPAQKNFWPASNSVLVRGVDLQCICGVCVCVCVRTKTVSFHLDFGNLKLKKISIRLCSRSEKSILDMPLWLRANSICVFLCFFFSMLSVIFVQTVHGCHSS